VCTIPLSDKEQLFKTNVRHLNHYSPSIQVERSMAGREESFVEMSMTFPNLREASPPSLTRSRHVLIGATLLVALLAFEIFNFDTTKYALASLLGDVSFVGIKWAAILAIAFCAIDFAGLARIFTPQTEMSEEPKEVWYLMGAWLLGATMNAIMTWWAVSLTLLANPVGNVVLSGDVLLKVVPIFVAVLVWLTRILFIGALSVTGDHLFNPNAQSVQRTTQPIQAQPSRTAESPRVGQTPAQAAKMRANPDGSSIRQRNVADENPTLFIEPEPVKKPASSRQVKPKATKGMVRPQRAGIRPNPHPATAKSYEN
jgi:hypothetical protein